MNFYSFVHSLRRALLFAALLYFSASFAAVVAPRSLQQTAPPAASSTSTRPCSANPVLTPSEKSKSSKKSKNPLPPEPAPACIEVSGEAIEIQEFLQATVRELQWHIGQNRASEDTWSFVRYFNVEQLESYADTKVLLETVEFTSGTAAITIRTSDASDGYVRVQISTHFQGEGKSSDKVMGQPGSSWTLKSKGALEKELITALQSRYKHIS